MNFSETVPEILNFVEFPDPAHLPEAVWRKRQAAHRERLRPLVEAHLARRARGEKHPVYDFLFEYYSLRPTHLLRWSPGFGVELLGEGSAEFGEIKGFRAGSDGVRLAREEFPVHRLGALTEVRKLLEATASRPAAIGCFGLHEWAMVYRAGEVRHPQLPVRLGSEAIAALVEGSTLCCTHYDAFRFFTPEARPLNRFAPAPDNRTSLEQPGCLHANMDLYKWAYKWYPWIPGELLADTFELAVFTREVDMRASPYDVSELGMVPVKIESLAGRAEYVALQREIAARAEPLRAALIAAYRGLEVWADSGQEN